MSITQQIGFIVEQLPETEQRLILELVKLINTDDVLTPQDLADIEAARTEHARGETTPDRKIDWD
ncbi:MAG: hypothetical protein LBS51_01075 [Oscillospiraceae bacterium]|jgi:hypothetical protein|nr:hypothetical protein [Oscillospiraceae bacterium]